MSVLKEIHLGLQAFFDETPSMLALFEAEFGLFAEFSNREVILDICFVDDFLFPEKQHFSIMAGEELDRDLLHSYIETFKEWSQEKIEKHEQTQTELRENFELSIDVADLTCSCAACVADYRNRLRETVYEECVKKMQECEEWLTERLSGEDIQVISYAFFNLEKDLDKLFHKVRYKLKKASLNRLDLQVKGLLREKFTARSDLSKRYMERLKLYFAEHLRGQGLRRDLIGDEEYLRFFSQLGTALWKNEKFLQREFQKLVQSVLVLKRKDISANILKEYLGQFWLYSEARKIQRKIIYHMGPTNSGKTYHAIEALCQAKNGCYLAPLRLLAGELFDTMNAKGVLTVLLTGEEVIEPPGFTHYSSTIEMVKLDQEFECAVIDEIQMMSDSQRGWAWTRALVGLNAKEIHICGDASAYELVEKIIKLTGDTLEIRNYERMTELRVEDHPIPASQLTRSDALIVFSRRNALKFKNDLENLNFKVSIVYGRLGPEVRREQARKFDCGETDIIVATDAISMGMNLPIRRIVFSTITKFIDDKEYKLSASEIKQIAGRAGRFKRFDVGYVNCLSSGPEALEDIRNALCAPVIQNTLAMVGPDLSIFKTVNHALQSNALPILKLSEFLRLFNTMTFTNPFYCVDLKEMIEIAEMVEAADEEKKVLSADEIFGFACAPVNLGMVEHVQYFIWILNNFVHGRPIRNELVEHSTDNIDYLENAIKCVELYQWLARHFNRKGFDFNENEMLRNKGLAVERLNELLSDRLVRCCSSCGKKLDANSKFNICDECFQTRRFRRRGPPRSSGGDRSAQRRDGDRRPNQNGRDGRSNHNNNSNHTHGNGSNKHKRRFPNRRR